MLWVLSYTEISWNEVFMSVLLFILWVCFLHVFCFDQSLLSFVTTTKLVSLPAAKITI